MSRYAYIETKGTDSSLQPMWVRTCVLQELCWRILNENVELFLPVAFVKELLSSYLFRGFGIHFNKYSLRTQDMCIRYFLEIAKGYLDRLIKDVSEGKSPIPEMDLDEFVEDLTKIVNLLEQRQKELPQEMEYERITWNRKLASTTSSKRFVDSPIEMIRISESITFVPHNGIVTLRWIESVLDRDPECQLPVAMTHELKRTVICFNIFKKYESEYRSLVYCHLSLKELYEREWALVLRGEESLFGAKTELSGLGELIRLFEKRLVEIQDEKKAGLWKPCSISYRIGEPVFAGY